MFAMSATHTTQPTLAEKLCREVARPVDQLVRRLRGDWQRKPRVAKQWLRDFRVDCDTVEPAGVALLQQLVRESQQHTGPIVEIGTLVGITTTQMALAKAPQQKIVTVDAYCWNPWGFGADAHESITRQVLYYLIARGEVELVRADKNKFYRDYQGEAPAMVFLDAMHDYDETKKDIEWARAAGAEIIAGHDYCTKFPGVMRVVDEFGGPRQLGGTVWVL
jgi:hypothetical protein